MSISRRGYKVCDDSTGPYTHLGRSIMPDRGYKKRVDPERAKRPLSAYIYFCRAHRQEASREADKKNMYAEDRSREVMRLLGRGWKQLVSDAAAGDEVATSELAQYYSLFDRDRAQYQADLKTKGAPCLQIIPQKSHKGHLSGYNLYTKERYREVKAAVGSKKAFSTIATEWRNLSDAAKTHYRELAMSPLSKQIVFDEYHKNPEIYNDQDGEAIYYDALDEDPHAASSASTNANEDEDDEFFDAESEF